MAKTPYMGLAKVTYAGLAKEAVVSNIDQPFSMACAAKIDLKTANAASFNPYNEDISFAITSSIGTPDAATGIYTLKNASNVEIGKLLLDKKFSSTGQLIFIPIQMKKLKANSLNLEIVFMLTAILFWTPFIWFWSNRINP